MSSGNSIRSKEPIVILGVGIGAVIALLVGHVCLTRALVHVYSLVTAVTRMFVTLCKVTCGVNRKRLTV
jgi:hypothetical protein